MKKVKSSPSARVPAKSASKTPKARDAAKPTAPGKAAPKKAAAAIRAKAGSASPKAPAQKLPAMKKAAAPIKPAAPQPASVKPTIAPKKSPPKPPTPPPAAKSAKSAKSKRVKAGPATPPQVAVNSPVKPNPKTPKPAAKPKVESSTNKTAAPTAGGKTNVKGPINKPAQVKKAAVKKVPAKKAPVTKSVKKPSRKTSPAAAAAKKATPSAGATGKPSPKLPPKKPALADVPPILLEGDEPKRPAVAGPGTRFHLGDPGSPRDVSEDFDLPDSYGTGKVFLAARDPQWLHAHWDLTLEQLRAYNARSRSGSLMLRVYGDGGLRQEINVHPEARTWFVHVGRGGLAYSVELGGYDRGGAWFTVGTSEQATTPPDSLAEDVEPEFAERETVADAASGENVSLRPIPPKITTGSAPTPDSPTPPAAAALAGTKPRRDPGRRGFPQWTPAQAAAMDESVTMTSVKKTWGASGEITELLAQRRERALASAAAAGKSAAAAGFPEGGPADSEGLSSQDAVPAGEKPGFWFNVNAELIVYGATEPDARVTIGGRAVRLRPDGTFSFRFSLPDGEYELPIQAVAADGHDGRRAELEFARATQYVGEVETHPQDASLKPPKPEHTS